MRRLSFLKIVVCITGLMGLLTCAHSEEMTQELFKTIVARSGDTNQLRPELRFLPCFTNATCHIVMKFQDGRVSDEQCKQTGKTVDGKYLVFDLDSKFYHQVIHAIVEYDEKALAIRAWGLYGNTLTSAIIAIDAEKKTTAATASYAGGFTELSLGSFSKTETSERTWIYKDGVLFCTRDITSHPVR